MGRTTPSVCLPCAFIEKTFNKNYAKSVRHLTVKMHLSSCNIEALGTRKESNEQLKVLV